jgi:ribonuclease Z
MNGPFGDPGLFVPFVFDKRAFLFDIGDIQSLDGRDVLKISHIFVSHTHIDHFIGFDRLLRICLGRDKTVHIYGPAGIHRNVEGKLAGYTWNLVQNYENRFVLNVSEVTPSRIHTQTYHCRDRFLLKSPPRTVPFSGKLLAEPSLSVSSEILDHDIPCLGFALTERFHVNIMKDRLTALGLPVGPWIGLFKKALFEGRSPAMEIAVPLGKDSEIRRYPLGELSADIARITPGQKIAYVTDAADTPANREKIRRLALDADQLFIESAFLAEDREMAERKHHLTAHRAGALAGEAGARQFTLFHFSPRYTGREQVLIDEATAAYHTAVRSEASRRP